jgi:hypothetical protein
MNGKGDKPRPLSVSRETFGERWDAVFGRKWEPSVDSRMREEHVLLGPNMLHVEHARRLAEVNARLAEIEHDVTLRELSAGHSQPVAVLREERELFEERRRLLDGGGHG